MKEYKLKKWYPSLPKDWEVGMLVGIGDRCTPTSFSPCNSKYTDYYEPYENIINNPEFWEEVPEKDYEILSFKICNTSTYEGFLFVINKDKTYTGFSCAKWSLETMLKGDFKIHSVKRLSDGEIFTVGDIVTLENSKTFTSPITKFELTSKDDIMILYKGWDLLKHVSKVKKPLFTTEDGINIFEGDKYFAVHKETFQLGNSTAKDSSNKWFFSNGDWVLFSTKKAAEEYILMNKPCLSINDIKTLLPNTNFTHGLLLKIKELAKSKLL